MESKVEKETREILELIKLKQDLLNLVMNKKGEIVFKKAQYINSWNIRKIRGVYFTEKAKNDSEEEWNAYVAKVRNAIGVEYYYESVRNEHGKMVGLLAFYNDSDADIKMKHFTKWKDLFSKVDSMEDLETFSDTFDAFKKLLDAREYDKVNALMETYLSDKNKKAGDLKTVLVITKAFKNYPEIAETRQKIVDLLEYKLGTKLV